MRLQTIRWGRGDGWSSALPEWDSERTLVFAFGASDLLTDPAPLHELVRAYPSSSIVGCSTAGEILGDTFYKQTLVVTVVQFATTSISVAHEPVDSQAHSYQAGQSLGKRLWDNHPRPSAIFVLSDGLNVNGSALVSGLVDGSHGEVSISGGLAGDDEDFKNTWTLIDGEPRAGYVSAVGLGGPNFRTGHGSRGGWGIFGPERRVTRSDNNVLYELDGQPALALYKRYLGDRAAGLPATALLFPLAVRVPGTGNRPKVRTILAVDEQSQSMTFAGDIPEGSTAQLMWASFDRIIDGAHLAAVDTQTQPDQDALAVAVSCVGRRMLLGKQTEDELEATRAGLPADTTLVGFYSYGEVSSLEPGVCDLHNQTMTLTTFWEETP